MHFPPHALEEMVLSNMWGIVALVEVLERKGLLTRDEIREAIRTLQERHPDNPPAAVARGNQPTKGRKRRQGGIRRLFPGV